MKITLAIVLILISSVANAAKIPKDVRQVLNSKLNNMGDTLFDQVKPDVWVLQNYKLVEETPTGYILKLEMKGKRKSMICPVAVDFGGTIQDVFIDFTDKRQCASF